jgi:tRNA U34 5-carboxymethylaminomethyl modifying GTPase MnmE/TrmE
MMMMENREYKLKEIYNMVVLGNTGVGKSSLLNMLGGKDDAFEVGDNTESVTQYSNSKVLRFMGKESNILLRLIDTQGLSDTGGDTTDMVHIKNMVDTIRKLESIDLFLICLDGTNPRFTSYVQDTISLFSQIFPDFLFHSVLVFNKWTTPDMSKLSEQKSQYQQLFKKVYEIQNIPCFFIDSWYNKKMLRDNDDGIPTVRELHPNIQARTNSQIIELATYLILKETMCDVRSIEPKDTLLTSLENEKKATQEELGRVVERHKIDFEKLKAQHLLASEHAEKLKEIEINGLKERLEWEKQQKGDGDNFLIKLISALSPIATTALTVFNKK